MAVVVPAVVVGPFDGRWFRERGERRDGTGVLGCTDTGNRYRYERI